MNSRFTVLFGLISSIALMAPGAAAATSCENLTSLALPGTTITVAKSIPAGGLDLAGARTAEAPDAPGTFKDLPAFCRIAATLKPTEDSDIKIEVWMPSAGWNGKFQAVGNGGWAGSISYTAMAQALQHGYATTSTDTGHVGATGSFALGHPEKLNDFGFRSVHEMTVKAKTIVKAFYGDAPKISYWNGCSTGGRQGLKEAQRFPNDYDAIVAGAPANPRTRLSTWQMWAAHAALKDPASAIPPSKYPIVHKAVLDACDAKDGLKDGLIDDPRLCNFDPKVLQCKDGDGPSCLTTPQVEAVRKLLSPAKNPRTGEQLTPRTEPGSELGWRNLIGGPEPFSAAVDQFKYVVFQNPNWDWRSLNFDSDIAREDAMDKGIINATDPNLKEFFSHGGKILMYHGWSDTNVAPAFSVNYYASVLDTMGGEAKTKDSIRLFMAPGMAHCGGGEGPNTFDKMTVMERWQEKGQAPERIVASHLTGGKVDRSRPLCAYPQVARYKGTGSIDDEANFVCRLP
jgi:feruloyl esterase